MTKKTLLIIMGISLTCTSVLIISYAMQNARYKVVLERNDPVYTMSAYSDGLSIKKMDSLATAAAYATISSDQSDSGSLRLAFNTLTALYGKNEAAKKIYSAVYWGQKSPINHLKKIVMIEQTTSPDMLDYLNSIVLGERSDIIWMSRFMSPEVLLSKWKMTNSDLLHHPFFCSYRCLDNEAMADWISIMPPAQREQILDSISIPWIARWSKLNFLSDNKIYDRVTKEVACGQLNCYDGYIYFRKSKISETKVRQYIAQNMDKFVSMELVTIYNNGDLNKEQLTSILNRKNNLELCRPSSDPEYRGMLCYNFDGFSYLSYLNILEKSIQGKEDYERTAYFIKQTASESIQPGLLSSLFEKNKDIIF